MKMAVDPLQEVYSHFYLCPVRVSIVLYFFYSIRLKFHCLTDAAHLYSALHAVSPAIFRSTLRQNFVVKYCRIIFYPRELTEPKMM